MKYSNAKTCLIIHRGCGYMLSDYNRCVTFCISFLYVFVCLPKKTNMTYLSDFHQLVILFIPLLAWPQLCKINLKETQNKTFVNSRVSGAVHTLPLPICSRVFSKTEIPFCVFNKIWICKYFRMVCAEEPATCGWWTNSEKTSPFSKTPGNVWTLPVQQK